MLRDIRQEDEELARQKNSWGATLLLTLLWVNFVYFWLRVYRTTWASDFQESLGLLSVLMIGYAVIVTVWIAHNIRIYKNKGSRRGVRVARDVSKADALQHQISYRTDPRTTQSIVIEIVNGQKIFSRRAAEREEAMPTGS